MQHLILFLNLLLSPALAGEFGPADDRVAPLELSEAAEAMPEDREPESLSPLRWDTYLASAYQPYCPGCSGITADGTKADPARNIIAVDPRVLRMGHRYVLKFPDGQCRIYTARDTGGGVKGKKIDILVRTNREAYAWGLRNVQIAPVGKEDPAPEILEASGCAVAAPQT